MTASLSRRDGSIYLRLLELLRGELALDRHAGYADYEVRAGDRTIPLVRLERAGRL